MNNNVSIKEFCEEMRKDKVSVELAEQYLMLAFQKNHIGFVNLFIPMIRNSTVLDSALREAAESGYKDVVGLLLKAGADVHADDDCALYLAAENGHKDVVELLLKAGANVHTCTDLALYYAAKNGHKDIVELLLKAGANVHANNDSALYWAAEKGHKDVVELLLKAGANNAWTQ